MFRWGASVASPINLSWPQWRPDSGGWKGCASESSLGQGCSPRRSALAGEVCFETVREKVRLELDMYVDMPGFIDLFEFVVNMGANDDISIPQLLEFGSKLVDQRVRQLALVAFAEVNKVHLSYPPASRSP